MINIYEVSQQVLAERHYEAVVEELMKKDSKSPATLEKWFKAFNVNYTLKHIITARPEDLRIMMSKCKSDKYPECILELYDMYVKKFSKSDRYIGDRKQKYNAVQLMKSLEIKVCPLCNRNYINNVKSKGRLEKRTGQLDHFHNKSSYPFLSMSFFNLVPACYGCNHTKARFELEQTPYAEVDLDPLIRFSVSFNKIEDIFDEQHLRVSLDNHPSIQQNVDVLGLLETYTEEHNEDAFAVVKAFKNYNDVWQNSMIGNIKGLFKDKDHLSDMLLSEYIGLKDRLKSKPLAKLKKDIYEQLEAYQQSSISR
ncbi:hypothetical protein C0Q44_27905 [Paenibacillus sp. PCH8]|uniref:hypothetical protein n=1 Tax=Paenibacillus sp. PCH8 TaxID=2066524 RepID=UPI000CF995B7|nr:hypothetical protein [Paenibacillus sp. PCH8]PQP80242.1 hypothetical protein C0Q44_27905 [Paenibacillus sp. PCH8]